VGVSWRPRSGVGVIYLGTSSGQRVTTSTLILPTTKARRTTSPLDSEPGGGGTNLRSNGTF
jgi:hypothetical protein